MEYKHLELWQRPDSYFGAEWPDHYVAYGQNRDSDTLTRSNFQCILDRLGGESETVIVVRERHWACGWIEWIGIDKSDTTKLDAADSILSGLDRNPVVDDDHWSELEHSEICEQWDNMTIRERMELCKDCGNSIFAARHSYIPENVYDRLRG